MLPVETEIKTESQLAGILHNVYMLQNTGLAEHELHELGNFVDGWCETLDEERGGKRLWRGSGGVQILNWLTGCEPVVPNDFYLPKALASQMLPMLRVGDLAEIAIRNIASYRPDVDWAIELVEGKTVEQMYKALVNGSMKELLWGSKLSRFADVEVMQFWLRSGLKVDVHELYSDRLARYEGRTHLGFPLRQVFGMPYAVGNHVYVDMFAREMARSNRVSGMMTQLELPLAMVAVARHFMQQHWYGNGEGEDMVELMIKEKDFWDHARTLAFDTDEAQKRLQDRRNEIVTDLTLLLMVCPHVFSTVSGKLLLGQTELAKRLGDRNLPIPENEIRYKAKANTIELWSRTLGIWPEQLIEELQPLTID